MPKKKGKKGKKKGKAEDTGPQFHIRDLTSTAPLDGLRGAIGIEGIEMHRKIDAVKEEMALRKMDDAAATGSRSLDISDHSLHELPVEIEHMKFLQEVDCSSNWLVNGCFENLRHVSGLRKLNVSTNFLSGALPDALGELLRLQELRADENMLTALPETAPNLVEMAVCSLKKNALFELPPACLAGWKGLRFLDLSENQLKAIPAEIGQCILLERCILNNNQIDALPETLGQCTSLTEFQAASNKLTAVPETLGGCAKLKVLSLGANAIAEIPGAVFARMTELEELYLFNNKLSSLPSEIGAAKGLRTLSLSGNSLKSLPDEVGEFAQLKECYLMNNPLSSLPEAVSGWASVTDFVSKGCKLKSLPAGVSVGWKSISNVDVRSGGKKDTCKLPADFAIEHPKCRVVGEAKGKKGKKGKKK
jgi:Leucine-rich repeat (LRR) protein